MLGWINISIKEFISSTFGADKWDEVLKVSGVDPNWTTSCPYSDRCTYDLVVTAAGLLGVQVNEALEAYGSFFVQHVEEQGYTKLLGVLGANLAEFLQNLNDLHLHLSYCWPAMIAPSFRCEQVTAESLHLHYFSNRPGLWPIVVGVLKGLSSKYFGMELKVELLHSREKGDCDHEVFLVQYPYQQALSGWGGDSDAAQRSLFSMPAALFYRLHPFHVLLDSKLQLLQWGSAVGRVMPALKAGDHVRSHFRCKVPSYINLDYQSVLLNTHSSFVLQARNTPFTLKGQMLPTVLQLPGAPPGSPPEQVVVFLASPRMRSLEEMQDAGVYLSDIPRYDLSSDYILLAETRQAEADLKDKYERLTVELKAANDKLARTTAWLEEEKARAEALLFRMSGLIACFPAGPNNGDKAGSAAAAAAQLQQQLQQHQQHSSSSALPPGDGHASQRGQHVSPPTTGTIGVGGSEFSGGSRHSAALDRIEAVRAELARANITTSEPEHIQCLDLLGEGTYGKVYKGLWKGSIVAVKTVMLPAAMSGQEKREKMAIMEAAISSALSHPNIMATYTYDIKPIKDSSRGPEQKLLLLGSTGGDSGTSPASSLAAPDQANVHSFQVRLVCEYCDRGSLREALDLGAFKLPDGSVNYPAVLDTVIEIVTAVLHLHERNVLHADLKARNIMLKSSGSEGRGVTAKVADFGLAVKMDHMETHLSNAFQGTMTHMAPEIMLRGHTSKAADVYALGMVLWETYTAKHVFRGIPRALLGHQITLLNKRPEFPTNSPEDFARLTARCWDPNPANRPTLEVVLSELQAMRAALRCRTKPLAAYDIESHLLRKHSTPRKSQAQAQRPAAVSAEQRPGGAAAGGPPSGPLLRQDSGAGSSGQPLRGVPSSSLAPSPSSSRPLHTVTSAGGTSWRTASSDGAGGGSGSALGTAGGPQDSRSRQPSLEDWRGAQHAPGGHGGHGGGGDDDGASMDDRSIYFEQTASTADDIWHHGGGGGGGGSGWGDVLVMEELSTDGTALAHEAAAAMHRGAACPYAAAAPGAASRGAGGPGGSPRQPPAPRQ